MSLGLQQRETVSATQDSTPSAAPHGLAARLERNVGQRSRASVSASNAPLARRAAGLLLLGVLGAGGCKRGETPALIADPTTGVAKAALSDAAGEPPAVQGNYTVAPGSVVEFVGSNLTLKQEGKFTGVTGSINLPDADPTHASVVFSIDVNSLQTANADLTKHLLSPDFLDAAKFPTARFASTRITAAAGGYQVEGVFDLHGVKKQIGFPAQITVSGNEATATSKFLLNRQPFGVVYPGAPDNLIRDDVVISLTLRATRAQ